MEDALALFREMVNKGISPNFITCDIMMQGFFQTGRAANAKELFLWIIKSGIQIKLRTYNMILHGLCKNNVTLTAMDDIGSCTSYREGLLQRLKKEVLQKCSGVPFVAVSLGHKVRLEKDRSKWATVVRNEHWNASDYDSALRLSYAQVESHLKPCFAYTSIIPPMILFNEEWRIQHWMAQEFILPNPDTGTVEVEEIGRFFFRYLVELSFFQRAGVDPTGEQHSYILSPMMRDLALQVSGEDCKCYIMGMGVPLNHQQKVRHLTIDLSNIANQNMFDFNVISESRCLCTLLVVGGSENFVPRIPEYIEKRFPRLQTLDLSNSGVTELPGSIGQLKHLRCLQLQSTMIKQLPKSIYDLYLFQTLGLRNCYFLEELPHKIKNPRKLRHIDLVVTHSPFRNVCSLTCMPKEIGLLTDLQTLSRFVISKESTVNIHTHKRGIEELAKLNHLHGGLLISGLEHVNDVEEAARAQLVCKQFLRKIGLSWSGSNKQDEQNMEHVELVKNGQVVARPHLSLKTFLQRSTSRSYNHKAAQIMEHLKPPTIIEELTISGYAGMACPRWFSSPDYLKLVTLHLYDFKNCTVVPHVGQLPLLENLHIKGWGGLVSMNRSKFCGSNTTCFRSLKKLHLERLDRFA
uniref:NB-ARC domain-containing protein n=1 Tax=Leersia perrieri TaxID=77586 RepID=A0A0D9XLB6_9ORYZ